MVDKKAAKKSSKASAKEKTTSKAAAAPKPYKERSKPQQKLLVHQVAAILSWLKGEGLKKSAEKLSKGLELELGTKVKLPKGKDIKGSWKFNKSKDYDTEEESSSEEEEDESEYETDSSEESSSGEYETEEEEVAAKKAKKKKAEAAAAAKKAKNKKKTAKKKEESSSSGEEESSSEEEEKPAKKGKAANKKKTAKKVEESSSSEEESSSEEDEKPAKKGKATNKKKPAKKVEESSSSEEEEESSSEEKPAKKGKATKKEKPAKKKVVEEESSSSEEEEEEEETTTKLNASCQFQMFKEMEAKEEYQKLKMAGFLRELHKLAKEEAKEELRKEMNESARSAGSNRAEAPAPPPPPPKKEGGGGGNISLDGIDDLAEIPKDVALEKIEAVLEGRGQGDNKLNGSSVLQLAQAAIKVMGEQESVVDLREEDFTNTTVVGDLHGSLDCLKCVLELVGLDKSRKNAREKQVVIFGGDYVDRGANSLEVLCTLLLLKLSHPDTVHLLRGNHEDSMTASIYGFREEIDEKYEDPDEAEEIWYEFGMLFAAIPICAWTKNAAIMHGGIPYEGFTLERVKEVTPDVRVQLKTVVDPYDDDERVVQGVMWSDPSTNPGIAPNDRGGGSQFGPDVTEEFLDEHDVRYVIRAHEPFEQGTDHQDIGDGRGCVTVFSASNYPNGEGTNLGAILHLDEEKGTYETCTFNSAPSSAASEGGVSNGYEMLLKKFVDDHRSHLTKAFRKEQAEDGTVTPQQWAKVVRDELELHDLDWMELQPQLAPAKDGKINWSTFLSAHSSKLPNKDMLEESQLSLLHQHKDKFLNIFQLLDADGSGTISEVEFVQGIHTLNWESGGTKIEDPAALYKVFDIDGDGEITIEEFCKGLEQSAQLQSVTDKLDANEVQSLQENHEMLLLAFKYLDTDKSGAIDREEFSRGIELLNKRLPERNKLGDPEELFNLLDADGNGEIDLNEFNAMFRVI